MASQRRIELLLTNTVDTLGIVGDVVRVRTGYARNYLIPMGLAELPTPEKIEALQSQRDEALKSLAARKETEQGLAEQLEGEEEGDVSDADAERLTHPVTLGHTLAGCELGKLEVERGVAPSY